MGQSPSCNRTSPSNGSNWTNKIYFDPEANSSTGSEYFISDSEMKSRFESLTNIDDVITDVWLYDEDLYEWQLTRFLLYHAFVVVESNDYYWSIEKNTEGITIQRCKALVAVARRYRRKSRLNPIKREHTKPSNAKLRDLVDWLYRGNELFQRYNAANYHTNCQGFAKRVFNYLNTL